MENTHNITIWQADVKRRKWILEEMGRQLLSPQDQNRKILRYLCVATIQHATMPRKRKSVVAYESHGFIG